MTNCAIVCEYNPFHSGHKYQLDSVRCRGADNIICIMSGNFMQSADPALCDKALRAECAVRGGADAVIELPALYATASAQIFAEGALKIISKIKNIKYIAMGATAEPDMLRKLHDAKTKHADTFRLSFDNALKSGKSYNAARSTAYATAYGQDCSDVFTDPNNMLCLEYIAAIDKFAPNIEPMIIKRVGARYGSLATDLQYISATAIRTAIYNGDSKDVLRHLPYLADEIISFNKNHSPNIAALRLMAVYAVKIMPPQQLCNLKDCSEGLEFLLKKNSDTFDYSELIESSICRRYGKKRIKRLLFDALTLQNKDLLDNEFVTRLLACKKKFDFSILPKFVKANNAEIRKAAEADVHIRNVLAVDERAAMLYNTISKLHGGYYNYSLVKV